MTDAAEVVDLYLAGYDRPIGVTPKHPLYSLDRRTWVPAGDLQPGERLETATGEMAIVERVESCAGRATVYNVEISRYHTYFVGEVGVWAHNACSHVQFVKGLRSRGFGPPTRTKRGNGKMYKLPNGTRVRIMPRPNRPPHPREEAKFQEAYYYRVSGPNGGKWGPRTPLRGG